MTDNANHPAHYTSGKVECINAIEAATVSKTGIEAVCTANIIKYLWRYEQKNGLEDVKKAKWYLERLIEVISEEKEKKDDCHCVEFKCDDSGIWRCVSCDRPYRYEHHN